MDPGARLRVAVPDAFFPDEEYQHNVQVGGPGPVDHPAADHKVVDNLDTLVSVFVGAGFDVVPLEWCDNDGSFHTTDWDIDDGPIYRSSKLDHRNEDYRAAGTVPGFASLIIDGTKPCA